MPYFYSPSTRGFYHSDVHDEAARPHDVKEISDDRHRELFAGQASGQIIVPDETGMPALATIVVTDEERAAARQRELTQLAQDALIKSDVLVLRHYEAGETVPAEWVLYREQLREVVRGTRDTLPAAPSEV